MTRKKYITRDELDSELDRQYWMLLIPMVVIMIGFLVHVTIGGHTWDSIPQGYEEVCVEWKEVLSNEIYYHKTIGFYSLSEIENFEMFDRKYHTITCEVEPNMYGKYICTGILYEKKEICKTYELRRVVGDLDE